MIPSVLARWPGGVRFLRDLFGRRAAPVPTIAPAPTRPYPWEAHYPDGLSWDFELEPKPLFSAARRGGRALPGAAMPRLSRPQIELQGDRPAGRPRRQGLSDAGRAQGRARRAVPAELHLLRRLLLRRAQGRRHGGQLQPALRRARDRAPDRGFRDLDHGHLEHQGALSQGRAAPAGHLPRDDRGGLHGRPPAVAPAHPVRAAAAQRDRRRRARPAPRQVQDADRQ